MGCSSSKDIAENDNVLKEEIKNKFYYCFTKEEITYLENLKKETKLKIKRNNNQNFKEYINIYEKIEMDFRNEKIFCKEYFIIYIIYFFKKNKIKINNIVYQSNMNNLWLDKCNEVYIKKNNKKDLISNIKINDGEYGEKIINFYCELNEEDYQNKIIIFEICYEIKINIFYGLIIFYFNFKNKSSVKINYNKNFEIGYRGEYDFKEISKYELFLFKKKDYIRFCIRDKRIKINIKDELKELINSKFTSEEIDQIIFSLNTVLDNRYGQILIYQKIIHKLENNRDFITGYYIILNHSNDYAMTLGRGRSCESGLRIIINELKINDILINKKEVIDINYISDDNNFFYSNDKSYQFNVYCEGDFFLLEFKGEVIKDNNCNFCNKFIFNFNRILLFIAEYGSSFKYEIILNNHRLLEGEEEKFKKYNNYFKNNDIITFRGYYNINECDYKDENNMGLIEQNEEKKRKDRLILWKEENEKKLLPDTFSIK